MIWDRPVETRDPSDSDLRINVQNPGQSPGVSFRDAAHWDVRSRREADIRLPPINYWSLLVRWLRSVIALSDNNVSYSAVLTNFNCFCVLGGSVAFNRVRIVLELDHYNS